MNSTYNRSQAGQETKKCKGKKRGDGTKVIERYYEMLPIIDPKQVGNTVGVALSYNHFELQLLFIVVASGGAERLARATYPT